MTVYLYVLDTLADWEIGYITAELNSKRYFRNKDDECVLVKVGAGKKPIRTMGGILVTPDIAAGEVTLKDEDMLILPGADTWQNPEHETILGLAGKLIEDKKKVAAICGATVALAGRGALDQHKHTSSDREFLKMICPGYGGEKNYQDKPAVADGNLITASAVGALEFTYEVIKSLGVFKPETLESWYSLFSTREGKYFYDLMNSMKA